MKKLMIVIIVIISFGCSSKRLAKETIYSPELDKTATAEVGENMFRKTNAYFQFKHYALLLDKEDRIKYRTNERGNRFGELEGTECALYNRSLSFLDYNCDRQFTHLRNGDKLDSPVKYKLIPAPPTRVSNDSFMREVIYQGKVDNKINISFQEFVAVNGRFVIRDAYTQNIEYELNDNGEAVVGFKGLRIKIVEATNLNITYQVIHDFN